MPVSTYMHTHIHVILTVGARSSSSSLWVAAISWKVRLNYIRTHVYTSTHNHQSQLVRDTFPACSTVRSTNIRSHKHTYTHTCTYITIFAQTHQSTKVLVFMTACTHIKVNAYIPFDVKVTRSLFYVSVYASTFLYTHCIVLSLLLYTVKILLIFIWYKISVRTRKLWLR